jgi:hypothetical protein
MNENAVLAPVITKLFTLTILYACQISFSDGFLTTAAPPRGSSAQLSVGVFKIPPVLTH